MASNAHGSASAELIVRHYEDERYATYFNPATGFLARVEDPGAEEPFWSIHGPEMLDISITNWCDRVCPRCYRSSTPRGEHMLLRDYESLLAQASECGVLQVALGGGNPNQHPDFVTILRETREEFGVVPNYTTNGRGLSSEVLDATARFCGAVAVSVYDPFSEVEQAVLKLYSAGAKVNLHFVLDSESIETAYSWLCDPPDLMKYVNALVFLNFKPIGRGGDGSVLLKQSSTLPRFIEMALSRRHGIRIGFDSCMTSALVGQGKRNLLWLDGCEAARFSMYISEHLLAYPCSFMEGSVPGFFVSSRNLLKTWHNAPTFRYIREKLREPSCESCTLIDVCRGGCPFLGEINLCQSSNGM